MSSSAYAPTLHLERRPSRALTGLLVLMHLTALGGLLLTPWPLGWIAAGGLVLMASLIASLTQHALLWGPRAVRRLIWEASGQWVLRQEAGQVSARLLGESFVHPRLMILNFRLDEGGVRAVVLPWDGAEAEALRRLRVRLLLDRATLDHPL